VSESFGKLNGYAKPPSIMKLAKLGKGVRKDSNTGGLESG
jgi:hypothetical protein